MHNNYFSQLSEIPQLITKYRPKGEPPISLILALNQTLCSSHHIELMIGAVNSTQHSSGSYDHHNYY